MCVRIDGGMKSNQHHERHGPADPEFPPPGRPWEAVSLTGRLVGWAEHAGLAQARRCAELGHSLADDEQAYLLGRLGHKLRSAVLALQESARQAAFGRPELMEAVFEQAQEVGRRAAAVEAAAIQPKDAERGVALGAVLNLALPIAARSLPQGAAVLGSETALVDAFTRVQDWMGGPGRTIAAAQVGSGWRISVAPGDERKPLPVPEMAEPLDRLMCDTHLEGWLDVGRPEGADIYLRAQPSR